MWAYDHDDTVIDTVYRYIGTDTQGPWMQVYSDNNWLRHSGSRRSTGSDFMATTCFPKTKQSYINMCHRHHLTTHFSHEFRSNFMIESVFGRLIYRSVFIISESIRAMMQWGCVCKWWEREREDHVWSERIQWLLPCSWNHWLRLDSWLIKGRFLLIWMVTWSSIFWGPRFHGENIYVELVDYDWVERHKAEKGEEKRKLML